MKDIWLAGRVVLPDGIQEQGSVLVSNGRIAALNGSCPENAEPVWTRGTILPGFIDIHVHGGGDADCMDNTPEAILQMAKTHCTHGTTAMVPTTMTCEDKLLCQVIDCFGQARKFQTEGATLLGLHLEGPYFSAAGKGAQPVVAQRVPVRETLEAVLERGKGDILRWDMSPELAGFDVFARVCEEWGVMPAVAHTQATADEALAAFDSGFCHVTHFYNATSTFHKKNGIVYSGVVEATYLRDDVTIELIGDGRHIPKQSMQLALRIKGPDKICLITDSMRAAGVNTTHSILGARDSGVPVIIKDDVAQLTDLSAYAGSICTMDRALRVAHLEYGLPLEDVSRMLSATPARLCGLEKTKGKIAKGYDADLVVMDENFRVKSTYVKGVCQHP